MGSSPWKDRGEGGDEGKSRSLRVVKTQSLYLGYKEFESISIMIIFRRNVITSALS